MARSQHTPTKAEPLTEAPVTAWHHVKQKSGKGQKTRVRQKSETKEGEGRERREGRKIAQERNTCAGDTPGTQGVCWLTVLSRPHNGPEVLKHAFRLHLPKNFTE